MQRTLHPVALSLQEHPYTNSDHRLLPARVGRDMEGCIHVWPITCIPGKRGRVAYEGGSISVQKDVKLRLFTDFHLTYAPNLTICEPRRTGDTPELKTTLRPAEEDTIVWGVAVSDGG